MRNRVVVRGERGEIKQAIGARVPFGFELVEKFYERDKIRFTSEIAGRVKDFFGKFVPLSGAVRGFHFLSEFFVGENTAREPDDLKFFRQEFSLEQAKNRGDESLARELSGRPENHQYGRVETG